MKNVLSLEQLHELMDIIEPSYNYLQFFDAYEQYLTITDDGYFCHTDDTLKWTRHDADKVMFDVNNGRGVRIPPEWER